MRPTPIILCLPVALLLSACDDDPGLECEKRYVPDADGRNCVLAPPGCGAHDANSILADCAAAHRDCFDNGAGAICGVCAEGFREDGDTCVAVTSCAALACAAEQRECLAADAHSDAVCGGCLGGTIDDGGVCAVPNCHPPETPGSVRPSCEMQHRVCVTGGSATCGTCYVGYVDAPEGCRPAYTCLGLGCVEGHRSCTPAGAHSDAQCGACMAGYTEIDGVCQLIPNTNCDGGGALASILAACESANRNCLLVTGGARCGGCKSGYREDLATGACELPVTCAALDCAATHQTCIEEPNGHCAGCLPGYIAETESGGCRAVRTCAELSCAATEECANATAISDAFCRPDCGPMAIWSGSRCEPCPPCDAPGEVQRWPWPAATGACICETAPGYFYSLSADVGPFRCDADGDGWVRESARISLESDDPTLRANARCDLRTIDRVELRNESGQAFDVMLTVPLALYETDRNDDDTILNAIWNARNFPDWGRRPKAAELNRLTKICHDLRMDYNDNGVADVVEYGTRTLASTMRPEQRPFNELAYFVELHRGWYQAGTGVHGRYVIKERSRLVSPTVPLHERVSLAYAAADPTHWRVCTVQRDAAWQDQQPPIGMDLATYFSPGDPSWSGMHHHSQFKCLIADPEPDGTVPTEMSPLDIAAHGYRINRCAASDAPVTLTSNPSTPTIACASVGIGALVPGDVIWAGVPYLDHGQWVNKSYERGCVNECIAQLPQCPGFETNPAAVNCLYDPSNFGKFLSCSVWEVCDGLDNNGNSIVDEGDPQGNLPCDTGELGACSAGTTHCINGVLECFRNSGPTTETCNGVDDNCDGTTDENDPEGGALSCQTGELGQCNIGRLHCENGALTRCTRAAEPQDEVGALGCNRLDDDCDGTTDEAPQGACDLPWRLYYDDGDRDGQGSKFDPGTCMCDYQAAYPKTSVNKTDCCDSDDRVFVGATTWYSSRNTCATFDYNCDSIEQKLYTAVPDSGCGICFLCGCYGSANGWKQSPVPNCGDSAAYYTHCNWVCEQQTSSRTQLCH